MKLLLKIDWTGANGYLNCMVLVLVKRARTARYLANYLSNCGELCPRLHGVRTTYIAGNGGGFVAQGKALFCSYVSLVSRDIPKRENSSFHKQFCSDGFYWRLGAMAWNSSLLCNAFQIYKFAMKVNLDCTM